MTNRRYYSARTGNHPGFRFDLPALLEVFISIFNGFVQKEYFQEAFGYFCVDDGNVAGLMGSDIGVFFIRKLRKTNLWPVNEKYREYTESDLFDVVELLFDYVSKPIDGYHHTYANCGWHYHTFNRDVARVEFRVEINEVLRDYGEGFELSSEGEILVIGPEGMETLVAAPLPEYDEENVNGRVRAAIQQYRRSRSSIADRRDAVRNLGDVLEFLRPKLKEVLNNDESDLFNILNNFGIRHHNERQQTNYEQSIFLSWLFYHYLAAIHSAVRLIEQRESQNS